MPIDEKDLLQANATILAGVLIFLSLTVSYVGLVGKPIDYYDALIVGLGMVPFIFSSYWLLEDFKSDVYRFRLAKTSFRLGLMYLFSAIVYFLVLSANVTAPAP